MLLNLNFINDSIYLRILDAEAQTSSKSRGHPYPSKLEYDFLTILQNSFPYL